MASSKNVKYAQKNSDSLEPNINVKGSASPQNFRCRRAVCEKCSNNKLAYITETGPSKRPRRVCDICKEESQWIRRFIE